MAQKWRNRLIVTVLFLGGCSLLIPLSVTGWGLGGQGTGLAAASAAATSQVVRPLELAPTEIATVARQDLVERLRVSGELHLAHRVVLRARETGRILDVGVREGQVVKAGDVLVRFETGDLQSALRQRESDEAAARAELHLARQKLDRTEQLIRKNIVAQEQLDTLQSEVSAAQARLESLSALTAIARTTLQEAEVLAPFDGIVAQRVVSPGARVSADADLLTIVDSTSLEARVLVSTRDLARVDIGQKVELRVDGLDEETIAGHVTRINPVADEGTRSVPVYVRVANHGHLVGGMFVTGSIHLRRKHDAIIVPLTSLREDEVGDYVLKVEAGHLVRQPVTVASRWNGGDSLEISGGLTQGDKIVIAPLPKLQPRVAVMISRGN